jgi:hypothetical protein
MIAGLAPDMSRRFEDCPLLSRLCCQALKEKVADVG